jgi:hypothetical protein
MAGPSFDFPTVLPQGEGPIESTHNHLQVTPLGDPALAYSVVLPKRWVSETDMGEQQASIGMPIRIGLYAEKTEADTAVVEVTVTALTTEVPLRDWLQFQADLSDQQMLQSVHRSFAGVPVIDQGTLYGPKEHRQVVRTVAFADGARVFTLMAMAPTVHYEQVKRDITIAVTTFALLNPTGSRAFEPWLAARPGGDPGFCVAYPESWRLRPLGAPLPGRSAVDLLLASNDENERLLAYLRVKAIDPSAGGGSGTPRERLATAGDELADAGVALKSAWREDDDPSLTMIEDTLGLWTAHGRLGESDVEIRVGVLERDLTEFVVSLMSVRHEDDRLVWMRSKRAYEIALGSVKRE